MTTATVEEILIGNGSLAEIERAALAGFMSGHWRNLSACRPEYFSDERHRKIFAVISDIEGLPDALRVRDELERRGWFDSDTATALAEVAAADCPCSEASADFYISKLKDQWFKAAVARALLHENGLPGAVERLLEQYGDKDDTGEVLFPCWNTPIPKTVVTLSLNGNRVGSP